MNSPQIKQIAIVGVGLIGGSFGMALKKRGLAERIIGIGRSSERLQRAVELGAIDSWSLEIEPGVRDADLIYISTPVGMEIDFIRQIVPLAKQGCIITDAGSTKGDICRGAEEVTVGKVLFVGGHPMAGSEVAGVEAGSPDLFINAAYVLTPTEHTDPDALAVMRSLAEAIGSRVITMSPEAHDRCAAIISHLPHLIAAAIVSLAKSRSKQDPQLMDMIAGSFRDMTRVASSSPNLWSDICLTNVEAIHDASESFCGELKDVLEILEAGDRSGFIEWFANAKQFRDLHLSKKDNQKEADE